MNCLAAVVLCHRRKIDHDRIAALVGHRKEEIAQLAVVLRLAVLLCRTRSKRARPEVKACIHGHKLILTFPPGYLDSRPLTMADLEQEAELLEVIGIKLKLQQPK